MKKILIVLGICLALCGCSSKKEQSELDKIIAENNYVIIDVRTEKEYNEGHVKGSINIPYDKLEENETLDKNKTILVYCKSGNRSKIAYTTLTNMGYQVYDLGAFTEIDMPKE